MFKWALIFAVIALIAAVLGFGGVAGAAAGVAKILFFVGLALVVLFLILGSAAALHGNGIPETVHAARLSAAGVDVSVNETGPYCIYAYAFGGNFLR